MENSEEMKEQTGTPQEQTATDNLASAEPETVTTDATPEPEQENPVDNEDAEKEGKSNEEGGGLFGRKNKKEAQLKKRIEELEKTVAEQEKKQGELNDRFSRLYSEFDNYKKRTNREKLDLMATASERVILELLPVIDDYERAIQANEKVEDIQVIRDGFNLIYNKLQTLLKHFDVTEIEAKGEPFNTDLHEAITHFPAPAEEDKGKVMDVTQKGYKIKEKVIRYAKVVVAQ